MFIDDYDSIALSSLPYPLESVPRTEWENQVLCLGGGLHEHYLPPLDAKKLDVITRAIANLYEVELEFAQYDPKAPSKVGLMIFENVLQSKGIDQHKLANQLSCCIRGDATNKDLESFSSFFETKPADIPLMVGVYGLYHVTGMFTPGMFREPRKDTLHRLANLCWAIAVLGSYFDIRFNQLVEFNSPSNTGLRSLHVAGKWAINYMEGQLKFLDTKYRLMGALSAGVQGIIGFANAHNATLEDLLEISANNLPTFAPGRPLSHDLPI